ncbi:hypothetical protein BDZ97DRAFT_1825769 [Flammula alnicola]|nr:hypothetical protein BDZ97DRAFT_1825769 [Flammula alnicola]
MYTTDRKTSYKLPPTTIRDKLVSQEARRTKALEEQKRRRAQKIDSSRQLDLFAELSLAEPSDDEGGDEEEVDDSATSNKPGLAAASVAAYASLLQATNSDFAPGVATVSSSASDAYTRQHVSLSAKDASGGVGGSESFASSSTSHFSYQQSYDSYPPASTSDPTSAATAPLGDSLADSKKPRKRGGKNSHKRRAEANKASTSSRYKGGSKWADKCMYAELLEMRGDEVWAERMDHDDDHDHDGLPRDLEHGWVAVAPVPVGKRCLAVTQQSAGVAGVVPNTTLRSRLLGKSLLARFPSALPPLTVLDCILDANWRENGILHVLDVVRWKGQDVGECEAGFRFWWRDTRLAELTRTPPPSFHFVAPTSSSASSSPAKNVSHDQNASDVNSQPGQQQEQRQYHFPYPTTFVPVPYQTNTTLAALDAHVIPAARSVREISVSLPLSTLGPTHAPTTGHVSGTSIAVDHNETGLSVDTGMEVEAPLQFGAPGPGTSDNSNANLTTLAPTSALVQPDGLLLYVAEASYEPGTSPLSSWIPIHGYDVSDTTVEDKDRSRKSRVVTQSEGPLDLFHRLVRKQMARQLVSAGFPLGMHIGPEDKSIGGDVDMDS